MTQTVANITPENIGQYEQMAKNRPSQQQGKNTFTDANNGVSTNVAAEAPRQASPKRNVSVDLTKRNETEEAETESEEVSDADSELVALKKAFEAEKAKNAELAQSMRELALGQALTDEQYLQITNSLSDMDPHKDSFEIIPTQSLTCTIGHKETPSGIKVPNKVTLIKGKRKTVDRNTFEALKPTGYIQGFAKREPEPMGRLETIQRVG